jgi:hypothetical protein
LLSSAQPGGNVTGLLVVAADLESKRLEVLKDAVPSVTKVMDLYDPSVGAGTADVVRPSSPKRTIRPSFLTSSPPLPTPNSKLSARWLARSNLPGAAFCVQRYAQVASGGWRSS